MTSQLQNEFIIYLYLFFRELVHILYNKPIIRFSNIPLSMLEEQIILILFYKRQTRTTL